MHAILISAVAGYLLGSIPFGYLLVRAFRGADVRTTGSGNIGATNVARTSPALGIATLLLDALKGTTAVCFTALLSQGDLMAWVDANTPAYPEHPGTPFPAIVTTRAFVAALFAIIGHIFPVWLKFRGGKGVATATGAYLLLVPSAMLSVLAVFVVMVAVTRYISLSSITAAAVFPFFVWYFGRGEFAISVIGTVGLASALIIARHRQNLRRLLAGTEPKFKANRK